MASKNKPDTWNLRPGDLPLRPFIVGKPWLRSMEDNAAFRMMVSQTRKRWFSGEFWRFLLTAAALLAISGSLGYFVFALALAFVLDRRDTASRAFSLARGRLRISPLPREVLADLALAGFPAPDFASGFLGFLLRRESWRMRMVTAAVTYFGGGMALFFMWGARSADYQFVPLAIMAYAQGQLLLLLAYPYETLRWSGSAALRAMMSMTRTVPGRLSDAERAAENARAISSGVNDAWARTWRFLMIVVPGVLVGLALLGGSVSGWGVLQRVVAWQVAGATLAWRYGVILRKEYQDDFLILTRMAEALLRSPEEFLLDRGTIQRRRAD